MTRTRLDLELVQRGLAASRSAARNAIRDGHVVVDGATAHKPAQMVAVTAEIELAAAGGRYVGRGAHKLAAALGGFGVMVAGKTAIDVGSSTGGFTEVLLENGAASVVALDVGRDQLHAKLRKDRRVVVREGTNVRDADVEALGGPFDVVTADLSFISLQVVAPDLERLGSIGADWVVLVKPQFEVGEGGLTKNGLVLSGTARGRALVEVMSAFAAVGLVAVGVMASPISGGTGNREALLWLRREGMPIVSAEAFKVLADE